MEKHINVIAALHIGLSILGIIIGGVVFAVLYFVRDVSGDPDAEMVLTIIANAMVIFTVIFSIPGIIAGLGLFKRKEWARILTLILSVIDLFNIPVGTAVGVYSIWALVQPEVVAEFNHTPPVNE
ncbi:MAG TPA: hypothetical protein VKA38_07385 [Draconibacterium sp.]|nr:hypothetical protein [Draconibacterium sp.]